MGIFDFFSRKKKEEKKQEEERLKNQFKAMTIDELADAIDKAGVENTAGFSSRYQDFEKNKLKYKTYLEKLVYNPVEEGGFGGDPNIIYDYEDYFLASLISGGSYINKNIYGKVWINNYELEFLKNYIKRGNTVPLKDAWMQLIFKCFNDDSEFFGEDDIKNINHGIYHPWIYKGDNDYILYKIKLAIFLNDPDKLYNFGLYKPGKNGKPSDEYITIDDLALTDIDNEVDLIQYINSLQTRNFD